MFPSPTAGLLRSLPATRAFLPTRSESSLPICDGCSFNPLPGRSVAKAAVDRQRPLIPYNLHSPDLERIRSVDRGQLRISAQSPHGVWDSIRGRRRRGNPGVRSTTRCLAGLWSHASLPARHPWLMATRRPTRAATRAVRRHTRRRPPYPVARFGAPGPFAKLWRFGRTAPTHPIALCGILMRRRRSASRLDPKAPRFVRALSPLNLE